MSFIPKATLRFSEQRRIVDMLLRINVPMLFIAMLAGSAPYRSVRAQDATAAEAPESTETNGPKEEEKPNDTQGVAEPNGIEEATNAPAAGIGEEPKRTIATEKTGASGEDGNAATQNQGARKAAPPERFREGLGRFYADNFAGAAAAMYDYIATNEDNVENYEWAEYFLGVSLKRLGFTYGATAYLFNVAANRTRPEILPDALGELEELMDGPHDEYLLDDVLIVDNDFGYLPSRMDGFVSYLKGLADLRSDRVRWAERHFRKIEDDSSYYPKALYALGVQRIRRNRVADAVKFFRKALAHPQAKRELRNEARLALARVLYENERYEDALLLYNSVEVPELSTAEASLFLEKAWTYYWLKNFRKTMGILYALEAPSYREYFAPEKFLLRSLVYKNLCHYIPAKREVRRFRFSFAPTLTSIRNRVDLRSDDALRTAALQKGQLGRLGEFRRSLARENDNIDTLGGAWVEVGLDDHLREMYRLKVEQTDLRLGATLSQETRNIARDLVSFEEQMDLLDYEVGLAIYRRLRKEDARRPTEADVMDIPAEGPRVFYRFVGEFWNDELPTYDFFVENRCFDEGGAE
jgi:tetratricopeptide (TPR) repeat protein